MSKEEKEAIWYCSEILADNKNDIEHWKIVENLIDKLKKELEEKTTILMAGADKVKQLEKENTELKEKEKNLLLQLKDSEKELLEVTQNIVSKDKIRDIIEKSYNDIDYFNRDMRKDFEDLLKE